MLFFNALRVKFRDESLVKNKGRPCGTDAQSERREGRSRALIEQTEGAKFWRKVVDEFKVRGVNDVLIALIDGLKGFPEAITSVFRQATVQTRIVHLIGNSLAFVSRKDRKAILPAIKPIYGAETVDMAFVRLEEFEAEWGKRYQTMGAASRWAVNTSCPQDNLHHKRVKARQPVKDERGVASFLNDDSARKLLYLAIKNAGLH